MLDEGYDFLERDGRGRDLTAETEKAVSSKEEREVKGPQQPGVVAMF